MSLVFASIYKSNNFEVRNSYEAALTTPFITRRLSTLCLVLETPGMEYNANYAVIVSV